MVESSGNTKKGILLALFGFSSFVISDSCAKWLSGSYNIIDIVVWSYIFALITGLVFSPLLGGLKKTLRTKSLKTHVGRGLCNLGLATSVVLAFKNLDLTAVYPIMFLAPFMITIMAIPIYKEYVHPESWIAIAIGFFGVLVAYRPGFEILDPWLIVPFFTVFCIAGLALLARALHKDETLLSLSFYPCLMTFIVLAPYTALRGTIPALTDLPFFALAGVMLVCGISGVSFSIRLARFAVVAPLHYLQLPLAFTIGYLVFNETPDLLMKIGALIIAGSGLLLCFEQNKTKTTAQD
ncbi:MAG: DMT family transporter [Alphaproteobacteria bacterium]|nr:DMT family transporter [Alphaproteobacteria bacterium]